AITRPFRESRQDDVSDVTEMNETDGLFYEQLAVRSLLNGEGYIATMIAGGSTRQNVHEAPQEVIDMIGGQELHSKAAVPISEVNGQVVTYLDAFGENVARLLSDIAAEAQRAGQPSRVDQNSVGLLSNDEYRPEHDALIARSGGYGLRAGQIRFYHQPLGVIYVGTPEDVENLNAKGRFKTQEDYQAALALSMDVQRRLQEGDESATILQGERQPLGHGEFLHQMVPSGELLHILDSGKKWVFTKNIDNYAAKFDKVWLRTLGLFLAKNLDFQPEVSPRAPGMKGGNLLFMEDTQTHQLAETPNIEASIKELGLDKKVLNSFWFNDAVGLMSVRYIVDIYKREGQTDAEFADELRGASADQLLQIADRGRQKFPKLVDAKPAKGQPAAAVKVETNLWQSSGIVSSEMKIEAVGVRSARNFNINDYLSRMSEQQRSQELANLRFLATKQWDLLPEEISKARKALEAAMGRSVTDNELSLTLESY